MAIYHLTTRTGKAHQGRAVLHSEYISREGQYTDRDDIAHLEHGNMPAWTNGDPAEFWQACDTLERANGRAYREFEVALPRELEREQQIELVREYVRGQLAEHHAYEWAIHDKGDGNPHAHIMFSERMQDGFERGREDYFKKANSKNPANGGCAKDDGWRGTKYHKPERLLEARERWADLQNIHLERAGELARVDHRTLEEQGIDRTPQIHVGYRDNEASEVRAERFERNEAIKLANQEPEARAELEAAQRDLAEITATLREIEAKQQPQELERQREASTDAAQPKTWDEQLAEFRATLEALPEETRQALAEGFARFKQAQEQERSPDQAEASEDQRLEAKRQAEPEAQQQGPMMVPGQTQSPEAIREVQELAEKQAEGPAMEPGPGPGGPDRELRERGSDDDRREQDREQGGGREGRELTPPRPKSEKQFGYSAYESSGPPGFDPVNKNLEKLAEQTSKKVGQVTEHGIVKTVDEFAGREAALVVQKIFEAAKEAARAQKEAHYSLAFKEKLAQSRKEMRTKQAVVKGAVKALDAVNPEAAQALRLAIKAVSLVVRVLDDHDKQKTKDIISRHVEPVGNLNKCKADRTAEGIADKFLAKHSELEQRYNTAKEKFDQVDKIYSDIASKRFENSQFLEDLLKRKAQELYEANLNIKYIEGSRGKLKEYEKNGRQLDAKLDSLQKEVKEIKGRLETARELNDKYPKDARQEIRRQWKELQGAVSKAGKAHQVVGNKIKNIAKDQLKKGIRDIALAALGPIGWKAQLALKAMNIFKELTMGQYKDTSRER